MVEDQKAKATRLLNKVIKELLAIKRKIINDNKWNKRRYDMALLDPINQAVADLQAAAAVIEKGLADLEAANASLSANAGDPAAVAAAHDAIEAAVVAMKGALPVVAAAPEVLVTPAA